MNPQQALETGNRLIELLGQQRVLYRQLQELSGRQSDLIDGNDPEKLLRVLASRHRLIDQLRTIDKELDPIRVQWQEVSGYLPAEKLAQTQQLVDGVQKILGDILARDARDSQALEKQRGSVTQNIRGAVQGKKMNQAYSQPAHRDGSRYIDSVLE